MNTPGGWCKLTALLVHTFRKNGAQPPRRWCIEKNACILGSHEWLLCPTKETEARDLLEIIEARNQTASTIFCSQFDIPGWHEYLYDPTLANVICDRIIHNSHIITIKGDSMRKLNAVSG